MGNKRMEITVERFEELQLAETKLRMYKRLYEILKNELKRNKIKIPKETINE